MRVNNWMNWKDHFQKTLDAMKIDPKNMKSTAERRKAAEEITRSLASISGAIALQPVPIADFLLLTPLQIALVLKIGQIYGFEITPSRAKEVVAIMASGLIARTVVRSLTKVIPIVGSLLSAPVAYGLTLATGRVAVRYFEDGGHWDNSQLRAAFEKEQAKTTDLPSGKKDASSKEETVVTVYPEKD